MKTEEYMALSPFEKGIIDALRQIHTDLIMIETQLIELGKVDMGELS